MKALYPYQADNPNRTDYLAFPVIMKQYLHPSWQGIDTLEQYLSGLSAYWKHSGADTLKADGLHGTVLWKEAAGQIKERIDGGILVPFLLLYHKNKIFKDIQWHWFILAGYEVFEDEFYVKAVTYGDSGSGSGYRSGYGDSACMDVGGIRKSWQHQDKIFLYYIGGSENQTGF